MCVSAPIPNRQRLSRESGGLCASGWQGGGAAQRALSAARARPRSVPSHLPPGTAAEGAVAASWEPGAVAAARPGCGAQNGAAARPPAGVREAVGPSQEPPGPGAPLGGAGSSVRAAAGARGTRRAGAAFAGAERAP